MSVRCTGVSEVQFTEIDGVTTVWTEVPGLMVANLSFRVGQADERLPNRGITHFCEHLALSDIGQQPYTYNGATGTTVTSFSVQGRPDEVSAHLERACRELSSGRFLDRAAHERKVLRIEGARRGGSVVSAHLGMRYGARAHGLVSWPEFGLHTVTRDDLWAWAYRHFTAANAVLWLSGPPPPSLRLPLFGGPRNQAVAGDPLVNTFPTWTAEDGPPAVTAVSRRSVAAAATSSLLGRLVMDWLRHQQGAAYSPSSDYTRLDGTTAITSLVADGPLAKGAEAAWTAYSAFTTFAENGPPANYVADYRDQAERYAQEVHAPLGELSRLSDELVHGLACTPAEQISAETAALTPDSIRQCAADMLRTAVVQVPNATDPPAWSLLRYAAPDQTSLVGAHAVRRRKYRNVERWSSGEELAYSESVVGLRQGHVAAQAVTLDQHTVMLAYADGSRSLIDLVGRQLLVRPTAWDQGTDVIAWLDQVVPPERTVSPGVRWLLPAGSAPEALRSAIANGRTVSKSPIEVGPIHLDAWAWSTESTREISDQRRALPGALILGWLAHRHLLAPWLEAYLAGPLAAFRAGRLTPPDLFEMVGRSCTSDLATPRAAVFVADLMVAQPKAGRSWYEDRLCAITASEAPLLSLAEHHATPLWQAIDAEWQRRPDRGPAWLGEALSPPVPELRVAATLVHTESESIDGR